MKLTEALRILQGTPRERPEFRVLLACGFTPLHMETLLGAHLQTRLSTRRAVVSTGLFGDLAGTLERTAERACPHAIAVALEWSDLDPRLGFRSSGAWGPAVLDSIIDTVRRSLARLETAIADVATRAPVAICRPGSPLPPIFHTAGWQAGRAELMLESAVAAFLASAAGQPGITVVNAARLAEESAPGDRYSLKSDLLTGVPYMLAYADAAAASLALALAPSPPKKGLITDLDDTLWNGIAGEAGPHAVSWDLATHSHLHGLYQKLLASLAAEGVLIGIATKNAPDTVQQALRRSDLLLNLEHVFPIEVHWNAKSGSVGRILKTWNIGADSVVFVDDSQMELAEVAEAHPGIECIRFPHGDYAAGYALLRKLRDLFGKGRLAEEDSVRLQSIRNAASFSETAQNTTPEAFLSAAEATITVEFDPEEGDTRVLELVNKTNQFNLNGTRYTEGEWKERLSHPGSVLAAVSYQDRFGPLGKIAVIQGTQSGKVLNVAVWVMSCRAFSRRIEHHCLKILFERCGVEEIRFNFNATPKNTPLRDFLHGLTAREPDGVFPLTRRDFEEHCPPLYANTEELSKPHG